MAKEKIIIKGANENNLKNVDLEIPRDKLVVFTGLSGSGKSSLAFDTIYAEGQRRYVESLSAYARQFLGRMEKPQVEYIEGLSPAISIDQKTTSRNPRSTVGTVTEIYDYLRLLFSHIGHPTCHLCGRPIESQTVEQMVDQILAFKEGSRLQILAPLVKGRKGEFKQLFEDCRKRGFIRARVDGEIRDLEEDIVLNKRKKHDVELVVDRIILKPDIAMRLADSLETALKEGEGTVLVDLLGEKEFLFSEKFCCPHCGTSVQEISPRFFSFNSPYGACPECNGLGVLMDIDPYLEKKYQERSSEYLVREVAKEYTRSKVCPVCHGSRLKPEVLAVKVGGLSIAQVTRMSLSQLKEFFERLELSERELFIASEVLKEIKARLNFLVSVGLEYLSLDRAAGTLSGGEAQRIRLATQIGSGLVGVLYILDEPSIGLHQRDNERLIATLKRLRDLGNTLIVVEHDEDTIREADYLVDIGPGAGVHGGEIVAAGTVEEVMRNGSSETGQYLCGKKRIPVPLVSRQSDGRYLEIIGARENNLKNINVKIPLGLLVCVTGVSGSGKSTLINEILYKQLAKSLSRMETEPGAHDEIRGIEQLDKIINIDQSPIGRTPRSNPATYTGVFTDIRELFASTPEAKMRGYKVGRFSFNVKGGRCEACEGDGILRIEMHFLPDVEVPCEVCKGKRYNRETLEVRYKGKNIADVLEMTVEEANSFFDSIPKIKRKLQVLCDVGLGYIRLGQSATTFSGGEAQRIKLATELAKRSTGRTIYILDEPTTGLHFADIQKLLDVLNRLVDSGNTVVVIEHNLEVIKTADYLIDLGPEGGDGGGTLVAAGTRQEIAANPFSYTGRFLRKILDKESE